MSLGITIHINAEDGELTEREEAILSALGGVATVTNVYFDGATITPTVTGTDKVDVTEVQSEETLAEVKAEAEKPRRKRRTKAEIEADEAAEAAAKAEGEAGEEDAPKAEVNEAPAETTDTDPTAEEPSTTPDGADAPATSDTPTVQDAVTRAAKLMKGGKQPEVRALLAEVGNGAERISQLAQKDVPAFWAGLDELEKPADDSDIL